jgi:RNA-directed DNA polymerase
MDLLPGKLHELRWKLNQKAKKEPKRVYLPKGHRIDEWLDAKLEGWLGLTINREKTKVVNLDQAESLDFLGFTFRYDRDLFGSGTTYLNVTPSKKSLKKARDAIREKTGAKMCFKPTPVVVEDLNGFLRGWSNYFAFGYPRKAFRDLSNYTRKRMVTHLNRRSQRKYHRPQGLSHYQYLQELGLQNL